jgi:hypothetical protein
VIATPLIVELLDSKSALQEADDEEPPAVAGKTIATVALVRGLPEYVADTDVAPAKVKKLEDKPSKVAPDGPSVTVAV